MSANRDRILVLGGVTHHNRGDRAMHEGLIRWLRTITPPAEPLFLAGNPEFTSEVLRVESRLSPDVRLAQPWTRETSASTRQRLQCWWRGWKFSQDPPAEFRGWLERARAVFVPGSGSMNSLWWHDWLYVKAAEVRAAHRAGVPVFMTSQGIGPRFTHWMDRWVARAMFQRCVRVGVRDGAQSLELLREIGVSAAKSLHTGDDALLVPPDHAAADRILAGVPPERIIVGLNVRDASSYGRGYAKPVPEVWAGALRGLIEHGLDAQFLFVPISYDRQDDDRIAARKVAALAPGVADRITLVEEELDGAALRGLAARCHAAAGISYHFLLFCLAASVPTVGAWQNPYYQQKQTGLFRLYGASEDAHDFFKLDSAALCASIMRQLERREPISSQLARQNQILREASHAARAVIGSVL